MRGGNWENESGRKKLGGGGHWEEGGVRRTDAHQAVTVVTAPTHTLPPAGLSPLTHGQLTAAAVSLLTRIHSCTHTHTQSALILLLLSLSLSLL